MMKSYRERVRPRDLVEIWADPDLSVDERSAAARAIFRVCADRRAACLTEIGQVRVESPTLASRPNQEFVADVEAVCRRAMIARFRDPDDLASALRRFEKLLTNARFADADLEELLGRALADVRPYRVFPPSEYFGVSIKTAHAARAEKEMKRR